MIRGNMPPYVTWIHMMNKYNKKFNKYESKLTKKVNRGKLNNEKKTKMIRAFKYKHDPVHKYNFTNLEAADFYGLSIDLIPKMRINSITGNDIYSFRRNINNIIFNNTFSITSVGSTDDQKNQAIYEKFMTHFANPCISDPDGVLFFRAKDTRFGLRERLEEIPTAVFDAIHSKIRYTPFNLHVSQNESHLLMTDMIKLYTIYDNNESDSWFSITDLDVYSIGVIRCLGDAEIRYCENERYLNYDKSLTYEEVLFNIAKIIPEHFSNVDDTMNALGIKFVGIMISPYPLNIKPGVIYKDSFFQDTINHNIYNFYLIINQKY